ncbi:hypothetical protein COO92_21230 [Thalassospira lohafexi]|uniref:Transglycosylase SLT domain-containing protein n=1 Tax=Thalassospira lohafexi TaxID=744227 RepID=A0A2N3L0Z5_9PROT|nr:hypothetical protein COO92_21230 [Thalassospira lohafexi]
MNSKQLRESVIRPVLQDAGMWTEAAENLLMGTAAQESGLGQYVVQLGNGPARGIFQMEPSTLHDIQQNFLSYRPELKAKAEAHKAPALSDASNLICNLAYAALMCRIHYYRVSEALPGANDLAGLARYWKRYYNTALGKGSESEFIENYHRYVEG